jgi:hypothetical protein
MKFCDHLLQEHREERQTAQYAQSLWDFAIPTIFSILPVIRTITPAESLSVTSTAGEDHREKDNSFRLVGSIPVDQRRLWLVASGILLSSLCHAWRLYGRRAE